MLRGKLVSALVAGGAMFLALPSATEAASLQAGGASYTGSINTRQSSSTVVFTTGTGSFTCSNGTGSANPRLGSFGTGSITNSTLSTTAAVVASWTRLSFANQLLANATNTHDSTTSVLSGGTPNATPRCTSTISAFSGGCVIETSPGSTAPISAFYAGSDAFFRFQWQFNFYCRDGSGGAANATYQTGSTPGTPGPATSDAVPFNSASSTTPSTLTFTNVPLYRSSGATLMPTTMKISSAKFQLFTGTVYPGGQGVYVR